MKDPITFYASEDQWQIGEELYDNTERPRPPQTPQPPSPFTRTQQLPDTVTNVQEVAPYYVVVKIPGEEHAEFVLMLPFTPKNKPTSPLGLLRDAICHSMDNCSYIASRKRKLAPGPDAG